MIVAMKPLDRFKCPGLLCFNNNKWYAVDIHGNTNSLWVRGGNVQLISNKEAVIRRFFKVDKPNELTAVFFFVDECQSTTE